MREETNVYEGRSLFLERPEELRELSPALARLIPRAARELFANYPSSFRSLAAASAFPPLGRWLRRIAKTGRCELAIHRPGGRAAQAQPEPEIYVEVGEGEHPVLLSGGFARLPKRLPPSLAAILGSVGVLRQQYGAAGGLLAPARQLSLPDLIRRARREREASRRLVSPAQEKKMARAMRENMAKLGIDPAEWDAAAAVAAATPDPYDDLSLPPAPATYFSFYEDGCGGELTTNRHGDTWRLALHGEAGPGPALEPWLRELFDRRLARGPGW